MSELLNAGDVCRLFGFSRSAFAKLRDRSSTFPKPSLAIGKRSPRWRRADIDAWLDAGVPRDSEDPPAAA